jgi:hypothetical protein
MNSVTPENTRMTTLFPNHDRRMQPVSFSYLKTSSSLKLLFIPFCTFLQPLHLCQFNTRLNIFQFPTWRLLGVWLRVRTNFSKEDTTFQEHWLWWNDWNLRFFICRRKSNSYTVEVAQYNHW